MQFRNGLVIRSSQLALVVFTNSRFYIMNNTDDAMSATVSFRLLRSGVTSVQIMRVLQFSNNVLTLLYYV